MATKDKHALVDNLLFLLRKVEPSNKEQLFNSLSGEDLSSLLRNLQDTSASLRKVSALFLATILHQNKENTAKFCEWQRLVPVGGKVCLNRMPLSLQTDPEQAWALLSLLREQPKGAGVGALLWWVDPKGGGVQYLEGVGQFLQEQQIYTHFIDPKEVLFGITLPDMPPLPRPGALQQSICDISQSIQTKQQQILLNLKKIQSSEGPRPNTPLTPQSKLKKNSLPEQPRLKLNLPTTPSAPPPPELSSARSKQPGLADSNEFKPEGDKTPKLNEPKVTSSIKDKMKMQLEQFVSPVNRQKKALHFNHIKNNLVLEEASFNGAPRSQQKSLVSNTSNLFSPHQAPRMNFQTFVDSSSKKQDYRNNVASMLEPKKTVYPKPQQDRQHNSHEKMNSMLNRFISFYDNNQNNYLKTNQFQRKMHPDDTRPPIFKKHRLAQ